MSYYFSTHPGRGVARCFMFSLLVALALPAQAVGATAVSRIFGAVPVVAKGQADTAMALPMKVPAVFRSAVASVSGNSVTLAGSPGLIEDQFVPAEGSQNQTFYLFFESGPLAGRHFRVSGNSTGSVAVVAADGDLDAAQADDALAVHPYWTLGTLFSSAQGLPSAGKAGERPVEIILPAVDAKGTNPAAEAVFYHRDGAWRRVGAPLESTFDHTILEPDRPVIVRLNQGEDATLVLTGEVLMTELALPVRARADGVQDNLIGMTRPLAVSLNDLGLGGSAAFETTTDPGTIRDRVLLYSAEPGQNKVPTDAFYFYNGGWRKEGGDVGTDVGGSLIPAGQGFVIRKAGQDADSVTYWVNTFIP